MARLCPTPSPLCLGQWTFRGPFVFFLSMWKCHEVGRVQGFVLVYKRTIFCSTSRHDILIQEPVSKGPLFLVEKIKGKSPSW